jgi:SPP1 gp7 family putative phage head morphogenesis protein
MLRKAFFAAFSKRFMKLKGEINRLMIEEDALGMKRIHRVENVRWAFRTTPDKLKEFQAWLAASIDDVLLDAAAEEAYWEAYVAQGYAKGAERSFTEVMARKPRWGPGEGAFYSGAKAQFLAESFTSPVATGKVKLIAGRVFTDLKDITDGMSAKISRTLTEGLVQGQSPREVARRMNKEVDIGRARSLRIARTETIRAHAEGQLDSMERLGVDQIGVAVEWSTSKMGVTAKGYPSPCELCAPLQGVVMKLKEARGLLPRHPNCMCSYIPANVGEDRKQQKTQGAIRKAVKQSVKAEKGKGSIATKIKRSSWAGADLKPSKRRPQPLTNSSWTRKPKQVNNLARRAKLHA